MERDFGMSRTLNGLASTVSTIIGVPCFYYSDDLIRKYGTGTLNPKPGTLKPAFTTVAISSANMVLGPEYLDLDPHTITFRPSFRPCFEYSGQPIPKLGLETLDTRP